MLSTDWKYNALSRDWVLEQLNLVAVVYYKQTGWSVFITIKESEGVPELYWGDIYATADLAKAHAEQQMLSFRKKVVPVQLSSFTDEELREELARRQNE
jgi:hypothetical protein